MKKKQIIGGVIAAVLFILIGISSVLTNTFSQNYLQKSAAEILKGGAALDLPTHDYIAVVEVSGTIEAQTESSMFEVAQGYQHNTTLDYIDRVMKDSRNKGILLYVDSPGGAIYESEELYQKLKEYKEKTDRPIWNYMAHYAASGGYYVGMMSDKIYANPNTMTGSIGVIISGYDMTGLYEKLGIRAVTITSGKNKATTFNEEQTAIYQGVVNEGYERFVEIVAEGRGLSKEAVKELADGRIYTAKQAKEKKLVDEVALYEDMRAAMTAETGVSEYYQLSRTSSVFADLFSQIQDLIPRSESQILEGLSKEMESGVPMYYAEQLQ